MGSKGNDQDEEGCVHVAGWKLKDSGVFTWRKETLQGNDGSCQRPEERTQQQT